MSVIIASKHNDSVRTFEHRWTSHDGQTLYNIAMPPMKEQFTTVATATFVSIIVIFRVDK